MSLATIFYYLIIILNISILRLFATLIFYRFPYIVNYFYSIFAGDHMLGLKYAELHFAWYWNAVIKGYTWDLCVFLNSNGNVPIGYTYTKPYVNI